MKSFDSWFKKKFRDLHDSILCGDLTAGNYKKVSKKSYEAGSQSKQAEVDELRKRIDEALTMLGHSNGYGYEQCTRLAINILKGDQS